MNITTRPDQVVYAVRNPAEGERLEQILRGGAPGKLLSESGWRALGPSDAVSLHTDFDEAVLDAWRRLVLSEIAAAFGTAGVDHLRDASSVAVIDGIGQTVLMIPLRRTLSAAREEYEQASAEIPWKHQVRGGGA